MVRAATLMQINYDHKANAHGLDGPAEAMRTIFGSALPTSLLDVGCGLGTWLRAALDLGVADALGVDGIISEQLHVPRALLRHVDLTSPFDLGRRFDVAICLEVGEHLPSQSAEGLVRSLTRHADRILFSAAVPRQPGHNHVNCQWPVYWQALFNKEGFVCNDAVRWQLWDNKLIEPWYRQNIWWASRSNVAGREPRLASVVHPDFLKDLSSSYVDEAIRSIEQGGRGLKWYMRVFPRVIARKVIDKLIAR